MDGFLRFIVMAIFAMLLGAPASGAETYRLMQTLGNDEHESARGLSKAECETKKAELKVIATALGTYNEATGHGSITCLPESSF